VLGYRENKKVIDIEIFNAFKNIDLENLLPVRYEATKRAV